MANTGEIDPTELMGEIVEKALDSEPVRNLLGPLTKNIGLILGQVSDIAHFYTEQNLRSIFTKWAAQRKGGWPTFTLFVKVGTHAADAEVYIFISTSD